jgi:hypothetical protein
VASGGLIEDLGLADVTFLLCEFERPDRDGGTGIQVQRPACFGTTRIELSFEKGFFTPGEVVVSWLELGDGTRRPVSAGAVGGTQYGSRGVPGRAMATGNATSGCSACEFLLTVRRNGLLPYHSFPHTNTHGALPARGGQVLRSGRNTPSHRP